MACVICNTKIGVMGGNLAFKCKSCNKEICKDCFHKYGKSRSWGGFLGDKHVEIICPNCDAITRMR